MQVGHGIYCNVTSSSSSCYQFLFLFLVDVHQGSLIDLLQSLIFSIILDISQWPAFDHPAITGMNLTIPSP